MKKLAGNRLFLAVLVLGLALTSCGDTVTNTYLTADTGASNADLRHVALSNGTLSPAFSAGVTAYTALFIGYEHITVTPYTRENASSVLVNGAPHPHGTPTAPIYLAKGQNTITLSVISPDGSTQKSYTITAVRISQEAYVKASNTGTNDFFGSSISLSGDTLAVGAWGESSNATGVNGNQADNSAPFSGAVYVFTRTGPTWALQAYIKSSNTGSNDFFGGRVSLSGDTLAVSAGGEDSSATGINGNQADNSATDSGAVYVFIRTGSTWTQQAYIKSSNTDTNDFFGGASISLAGDTLAVGAYGEASNATGINGDQSNNSAFLSGAVYVFTRTGSTWSQQAYIKASNADDFNVFGASVSLSGDTLAVSATGEESSATGVNGNQADNSAPSSGAVYVFIRTGSTWTQQAYIKASNTDANDLFGTDISLSGDTLAISAVNEDSRATGINSDQSDNFAADFGAVYVFTRTGTAWTQQAYIKASNTDANDLFGTSISLSGDTLAVGAASESSNATGINGNEADNSAALSGAVYVFTRTGSTWTQQDYLKASNTGTNDQFGNSVSVSGETIAIGAYFEDSSATDINGIQSDNSATDSGAVYVFH